MRRILLLMALAACNASAAPKPAAPNWWCAFDGFCGRTLTACEVVNKRIAAVAECKPQAIAYCQLSGSNVRCYPVDSTPECADDDRPCMGVQ